MFGIGLWEFMVIMVLGVLLIGPEQLPKVARTIGKLMTQFKRATTDLRDAVNKEMHHFEEMEEIKEFKKNLEEEAHTVGSTARDYLEKEMERGESEIQDAVGKDIWNQTHGDPGLLVSPVATVADNATDAVVTKPRTRKKSAATESKGAAAPRATTASRAPAAGKSAAPRRKSPSKKSVS